VKASATASHAAHGVPSGLSPLSRQFFFMIRVPRGQATCRVFVPGVMPGTLVRASIVASVPSIAVSPSSDGAAWRADLWPPTRLEAAPPLRAGRGDAEDRQPTGLHLNHIRWWGRLMSCGPD
jgi:hypothetical protein